MFFFFNIVMTWKIVGTSKTSVLYIYIYIYIYIDDQNSTTNGSLGCETRIKVQFPPLHAEQAEIAKGAIESRRSQSDPLYFESLQLSSNLITTTQAKESIWKMKLEITMVVICCGGLIFGVLFRGRCILPKRFRDSTYYWQ